MFGYACDRCREKHQSCNHELPCKRCIKANVSDTCHYTPKRTRSKNTAQNIQSNTGMPTSNLRTASTAAFHHGMPTNSTDMNMFMGFPIAHPASMMDQTFMMNSSQSTGGSSNPGTPFNPTSNSRFPVHQLMNPVPIDPNISFPNFPQMMLPHHSMIFPFPSSEFQKQQLSSNMMNQSTSFLPTHFFPIQPQNILPGTSLNQMSFPQMHHGMMAPFPPIGMGHLPSSLPMMPQIEARRSITPNSQVVVHSSNNPNHNIGDETSGLDRISLPTIDHRLSQSGGFFLPSSDAVSMMSMMNSGAPGCMPPLMPVFASSFEVQRKSNSALCEALLFNSDIPHPEELHNNPGIVSNQSAPALLPGFHQGYTFPPLTSDINGSPHTHTDVDNTIESNVQSGDERSNSSNIMSSRVSIDIRKNNLNISNPSLSNQVVNTKDENRSSINMTSYKHEYDSEWKVSKDPISSSASSSMSRLLNSDIYQHQNNEE